ncbi:MAG: hypothetical protein R3A44_11810 [Caldilineaceae bacterium]
MAAQLLAAMLNLSAGAETCTEVVAAVNAGQALLVDIGFTGAGNYLRPKDAKYAQANALAATLDLYNNGELCSPTTFATVRSGTLDGAESQEIDLFLPLITH